ncbi:hypothetical protein B4U80_12100, partial [Leptotrombidium deliense]
ALINNKLVNCVVDTGSAISIIHPNVVTSINATINNSAGPIVKFANSETTELNQHIDVNVVFRESSVNIPMFVSDTLPFEALLGIDWCIDSNVVITCDSEKCEVEPTANEIHCNSIQTTPQSLDFATASKITLPARCAQWINLETNSKVTGSLLLQPLSDVSTLFSIPFAVCSVVQGETGIYAVNPTDHDITLKKGYRIAFSDFSDPEQTNVNTVSASAEAESKFDINPLLPKQERQKISRLLRKYAKLFKPYENDHKPAFEHEIELEKGTKPIHQRPYRAAL